MASRPRGANSLDQFSIQPWLPVHVAHHEIQRWPWRQTLIEVPHLEPAAVGNTAAKGQLLGKIDADRRDVDTQYFHATKGEPDRQLATPGGDF